MPKNKRESLIYTVMMCSAMVMWMSVYNIGLQRGSLSVDVLKSAWLGFPFACAFAMICDWFLVSKIAKGFAFRCLVKPGISSPLKTVTAVSVCMVLPMVIIMSMYGALEASLHSGSWNALIFIWLRNMPMNLIMALPFQLIVAGPVVRLLFRRAFPEGSIIMKSQA